jgi:hypothetical protein
MEEFASSQETQQALGILLELQEDPETLEGFFNKYPGANPFTSWPFLKKPTEAFLRYFETTGPVPGVEAAVPLSKSVDDLKLKELIEEFDREFAAAKEQRVNASTASKKFVSAFVKNAKKSNVTIPGAGGVPGPPERAGEVVSVAAPYPVPPVPLAPMPQAPIPQAVQGVSGPPERAGGAVSVAAPYPVPPVPLAPIPLAPVPQELQSTAVSQERIREIAVAAIGHPGPPEEKMLFFHALASFASEQPDREVKEFIPRATEVTEAARVLSSPASAFPPTQSFSVLATNNVQRGVAGILDVVVPPAAKATIITNILLQPLDAFVNHPETLPQNIMETMTDRWGTNFVNSRWFTRLRTDANRMLGDQKNALKVTTPFAVFVSDVATTVFRGPQNKNILILSRESLVQDARVTDQITKAFALGKNVFVLNKKASGVGAGISILILDKEAVTSGTVSARIKDVLAQGKNVLILDKKVFDTRRAATTQSAEAPAPGKNVFILNNKALAAKKSVSALYYNVITYIETYRLMATQGVQMVSVSHYSNIALGYGGQLIRMGADYVMKKAIKAGVKAAAKKAAVSTAVKLGAEAVAGAASGGTLTLAMMAADFAKSLINRGAALFKSLLFMGSSKNPEDNLILVVAAGIVLVFFLPLFPLLNIPAFNQSMIDTSLATSVGGIGGGGPYENGLNCLDPVNKTNPDCKLTQCQGDCAWPLETSTHACIIEGPIVGTHSDCRLSGIDFAGPGLFGAPVHTPYAGVVTSAVFGYPDNSGYFGNQDGGTYGNHVIVKADNGAVLMFAHLRNIQMVQEGPITKNTVVGFVDHTGFSGMAHLHYEDVGAGGCPRTGADINKYLPYPVPPCLGSADCAAQMKALGHSSCL